LKPPAVAEAPRVAEALPAAGVALTPQEAEVAVAGPMPAMVAEAAEAADAAVVAADAVVVAVEVVVVAALAVVTRRSLNSLSAGRPRRRFNKRW
jgi:hypothetical protein